MQSFMASLPPGSPQPTPGTEPGALGVARRRLLSFLETSTAYTAQQLISQFLDIDALYHERALLLGRIGRHDQALAVYAHVLHDTKAAEDYCRRTYSPDREGARDVYLSLLTVGFAIDFFFR